MFGPYGSVYNETKLIKQAKKTLLPPLRDIVEWASSAFGAKVLNAHCEVVKRKSPGPDFPKLDIIYEYESDTPKFTGGTSGDFNKNRYERTADEFRSILKSQRVRVGNLFSVKSFLGFAKPVDLENLAVIFSAFEKSAKCEANGRIPNKALDELKAGLDCTELWTISRFLGTVTFFFYTEAQAKEAKANGRLEKMRDSYFDLLTQYDEFKYFQRETFFVSSDSKEHLDKNYQGNFFTTISEVLKGNELSTTGTCSGQIRENRRLH